VTEGRTIAKRLRRAISALASRSLRTGARPPFTDLWPMLPGAANRLARAVAAGDMTPDEASQLTQFATRGYVIFPRAIEPELLDRLVRDVRSIADHPGRFVITDHKNGRAQRFSGADFDAYESIFDTYVNFESARRVCFHPVVLRFLTLLFDTPPLAFQQLLFQRSNQHPLHQDTSVVCVEEPLLMAASWIALEDVVPGRGELTYYEGSHRILAYAYADGTRRFNPKVDDAEAARRHLVEQCERLGCKKQDFFAKKGDVFVWAADLVHGSNPRTRPEYETRLSLVTHYCPTTTTPFWFRFHPQHRTAIPFEGKARLASALYTLPTSGGMARPSYELPGS